MPVKLGLPHLAHLRAVAEGVGVSESAQRYLGAENAYGASRLHAPLVLRARALARPLGDPAWRLIGAHLGSAADASAQPPTLEEWAEAKGYGGFRHQDLIDLYNAEYPPDRKAARAGRLRKRVLALLREIERLHIEAAKPHDLVEDWITDPVAGRLRATGLVLLADVQRLVSSGGRWWRKLYAIGPAKGEALARYVAELLPASKAEPRPWEGSAALAGVSVTVEPRLGAGSLDGSAGVNRGHSTMIDAQGDAEAIEAWIRGRGVNDLTARAYRREARRLYLWAAIERGKALSSLNAEDCAAFVRFLGEIPDSWIGRPMPVGHASWTPFAKQLSASSRRQAHVIIKSLFEWLHHAGYLRHNPWYLIGTKVADDQRSAEALLNTRAFTVEAWEAIVAYLDAPSEDPAHLRARFVFKFCEGTGLRSAELLDAKLADFRFMEGAWYLPVIGKGGKARLVLITPRASVALEEYLVVRGLPSLASRTGSQADAFVPLLASLTDPSRAPGYQTFYESMKCALKYALRDCDLPEAERRRAMAAAPHWLRRTFGTRAKERGVSDEALMEQMGHGSRNALKPYTRAQSMRVREELGRAFPS